jgi:hypothetical protein
MIRVKNPVSNNEAKFLSGFQKSSLITLNTSNYEHKTLHLYICYDEADGVNHKIIIEGGARDDTLSNS